MKFRNKKTGEVFDALIREKGGGGSYSLIVCDVKAYEHSKSTLDATHFVLDEYDSLASLNAEWEDYVPKDPLIKDEKIRKAVRAWAEAQGLTEASIQNNYCLASKEDEDVTIIFASPIFKDIDDTDFYTIEELCGEEENEKISN